MALLQNDCDINKQQSGTLISESFRLLCEIFVFWFIEIHSIFLISILATMTLAKNGLIQLAG